MTKKAEGLLRLLLFVFVDVEYLIREISVYLEKVLVHRFQFRVLFGKFLVVPEQIFPFELVELLDYSVEPSTLSPFLEGFLQ